METKVTTPLVKGLIISLLLIIYGLILRFTGQSQNMALVYSGTIIFVAGIIWACANYSQQLKANVTFGNEFAHGFKTSAVIIAIMLIYTIISIKFLFPEMVNQSIAITRQKLEQSGKMSDSQIDSYVSTVKDHFMLIAVANIIIGFAIIGLISSLIGAAIAKKKPRDPFGNQPI